MQVVQRHPQCSHSHGQGGDIVQPEDAVSSFGMALLSPRDFREVIPPREPAAGRCHILPRCPAVSPRGLSLAVAPLESFLSPVALPVLPAAEGKPGHPKQKAPHNPATLAGEPRTPLTNC